MRSFCITLQENEARGLDTIKRLSDSGVVAEKFDGIHGVAFGLMTSLTYEWDMPGAGYRITSSEVGCFLSHIALWRALDILDDDKFMVFEDDAEPCSDFQNQLNSALNDTPGDADILLIGSCCASDKPKEQIKGSVWEVKYPFCTHAYVVWKKALKKMIQTQRRVYAKVDISLCLHTYPELRVYTVLPRIVDQCGHLIAP